MVSDIWLELVPKPGRIGCELSVKTSHATQMKRNLRSFNRQLSVLKLFGHSELAAIFAQRAATFATYRHTGQFVSPELEEFLSDLSAKKIHIKRKPQTVEGGSTLHILSKALQGGGHTRVVERWINASPDSERHSLLVTRGGQPTQRLTTEIQKRNGEIIIQSRLTPLLKRAKQILSVSQRYSRVVLHVHMDDILPMLAFSKEELSAEITHFNHADHRFWVGASLPDRVLEMRTWGKMLSKNERGIKHSEVSGIPLPEKSNHGTNYKQDARGRLAIAPDKKVLITVGHMNKFNGGVSADFPQYVRELLIGHPERLLIAIGPKKSSNNTWGKLAQDFPEQVSILNYMPKEKLDLYIRAADLGLDSFPMSGGTTVLDMAAQGLITISLQCPTGHLDVIYESDSYCKTIDEWLAKANLVLSEDFKTFQNATNRMLANATKKYGREVWANVLSSAKSTERQGNEVEPDIDALNNYLVASTPKLARLFF